MDTSRVGRLGLSDADEDAIVSFMQTRTDGIYPSIGGNRVSMGQPLNEKLPGYVVLCDNQTLAIPA